MSSDFTPAQLDALEDALAGLEEHGVPDGLDEAVAARLAEYRDLLQMSREALPIEDVRDGLLNEVLVEATRAGAEDGATVPEPVVPKKSWWQRFRSTLVVPALAFAGSAALLIWIVYPNGGDLSDAVEPRSAPAAANADDAAATRPPPRREAPGPEASLERNGEADNAPASGQTAPAEVPKDQNTKPDAKPGDRGVVAPSEEAKPDPLGEGEVADDAWRYKSPPKAKKPRGARKSGTSSTPSTAPPGVGGPAKGGGKKAKADVASGWPVISAADAARRSDNCSGAERNYQVASEDDDKKVRARALAGLGLCREAKGHSGGTFYARARKLDPSVGKFIDRERQKLKARLAREPNADQAAPPAAAEAPADPQSRE